MWHAPVVAGPYQPFAAVRGKPRLENHDILSGLSMSIGRLGFFIQSKKMANATANSAIPVRFDNTQDAPIEIIDCRPMTSLVSYPKRNNRWGDPRFRGNCDGTLFRDLVLRYTPRSIADPMAGSGTTQDVVADLNRETNDSIEYWCGDLSGGFNLLTMNLPGKFDLVWVHPPQWNIVRYSDGAEGDLSCIDDFDQFCSALVHCLRRCAAALNPGGHLAVLVADIRRKGRYYSILRELLNADEALGQLRSIIIKAQHRTSSSWKRYKMEDPPIQHEYCVVIKRPEEDSHSEGHR